MKFRFLFYLIQITSIASFAQEELVASEDTALVHITVNDKKGLPEENAIVTIKSLDKTVHLETKTDVSGKFDVLLPEGKTYKFNVHKFGKDFAFDKTHQILEIPNLEGETELDQTLIIYVITDYSKVFTLHDVKFESGKSDLSEIAKKSIDNVWRQLNANPKLIIEIAGHTDDVGDDAHNLKLSQLRANSVRDYLFSKGIAHNRVLAKGYGETVPLVPNRSEVERAQNRRIEVKVIAE